jgi:sortase (surface protein transpeptidase)
MFKKLPKSTRIKPLAYGLIMLGIGLGALAITVRLHNSNPQPLTQLSAPDFNNPPKDDEVQSKTQSDNYNVPADYPKYINIPTINIPDTKVLALGKQANGAISTPNSSLVTGWYDASSKPGQSGAMFIYGHVASRTSGGIFYNLKNVKPGSDIMITRGDNTLLTYRVVRVKTYPYNNVDMSEVLTAADLTKPGLSIMSCAGTVVPGTKPVTFSERLVVFATLAD